MKIGLLAGLSLPVPPSKYGGVERVVYQLAEALVARGHEVKLFAAQGSRAPLGAHLVTAPFPTNAIKDDRDIVQKEVDFVRWLDENGHLEGLDVIHNHSFFHVAYMQGTCRTIVSTLHGVASPYMLKLLQNLLRETKRPCLVGVSHTQAAIFMQHLGTAIRVAYNPVEMMDSIVPAESKDHFVYASRITADKGALRAVEVAAAAKVPLHLVGGSFLDDGDYVQSVRKACEEHGFEMHGEVSREKWLEIVSTARAHLFPVSWPEPFGLVIPEAGRLGVPTIGTPNGALIELIQDDINGYLATSKAELTEYVRRVAKMSEESHKRLRYTTLQSHARFSPEACAARYERLYETAKQHPW